MKLRDMSEKLDWDGKWSASSAMWSERLKFELDYDQTYRDGSHYFYMGFDDYLSYFNSTNIVKLHSESPGKAPYFRKSQGFSHAKDSY